MNDLRRGRCGTSDIECDPRRAPATAATDFECVPLAAGTRARTVRLSFSTAPVVTRDEFPPSRTVLEKPLMMLTVLATVVLAAAAPMEQIACVTCSTPSCDLPYSLPACPGAPEQGHVASLRGRCEMGQASACTQLASVQGAWDVWAAASTLSPACGSRAPAACREAARMLLQPAPRGPGKRVSASVLLSRGCEAGDAEACSDLAAMLRSAMPLSSVQGATCPAALDAKACAAGSPRACTESALSKLIGGTGADASFGEARRLLQFACDRGSPLGCEHLGFTFASELAGVSIDLAKSAALREKGCAQPAPESGAVCARLAVELGGIPAFELPSLFREDRGRIRRHIRPRALAPDAPRARRIAEEACQRGSGEACLVLAKLLGAHTDQRVPALMRGCDHGSADACSQLFRAFQAGDGVTRDLRRALEYADRACRFGAAEPCGALAEHDAGSPGSRSAQLWMEMLRLGLPPEVPEWSRGGQLSLVASLAAGGDSGASPASFTRFVISICGPEAARVGNDGGCAELAATALLTSSNAPGRAALLEMLQELYRQSRTQLAELTCDDTAVRLVPAGHDPASSQPSGAEIRPYAWSSFPLGLAYEHGIGVTVDKRKALELYAEACSLRIGNACVGAALLRTSPPGPGTPANGDLDPSSTLELATGFEELAEAKERGADKTDAGASLRRALELRKAGCNAHDRTACRFLGVMLASGISTPRDPAAGLALLRPLCEPGQRIEGVHETAACGIVGYLLLQSAHASEKDTGARLLAKMCASGDAASCVRLSVARRDELLPGGVTWQLMTENCLNIRPWWGLGEYRDCAAPCLDLAGRYRIGDGMPQDMAIASRIQKHVCAFGLEISGCPPATASTRRP